MSVSLGMVRASRPTRNSPNTSISCAPILKPKYLFIACGEPTAGPGVMIAAYRIALEHTSVPVAVSEMYQFHYWKFLLPHLKRYVDALPKLLDEDAQFGAYASAPPVAPNSAAGLVPALSTAQQGQLVQ